MKYLLPLFSFLMLVQFAEAQRPIRCYTVEADSALRAEKHLESQQDFENWLQAKIALYKASPAYQSGQRSVVTIPIIFHVIHNGDAVGSSENLSAAQINSQIDVLNEDYRKLLGTNGYNTNAAGADCEIEFCAAVVDPNGAVLAEPGIDRKNMGQASWQQSDIDATLKPATYWDPTRYFNVWTVNFGGSSASLLGYAQFPNSSGLQGINTNNGNANTDGVVIRYTATGRVGTLDNTYNLGRTLTHESGHFFGLRHIWGDQSCGNDYCNDTPTASAANYGCPTGQNSCPDAGSDMVENYMDYTDDDCMNIFTNDQKTRMLTVLANSPRRSTLTSSNVCTIPFTFSYTGKVVDATTNIGIANAKVFFDGSADYNVTTDANGFFTIANLQQASYTVYAGKWGYVSNTTGQQAFTPSTPQITISLQPGYYDDFTFDFGWTVTSTATTGAWVRGVPSGTTYTANNVTNQSNPGADVSGDYTDQAFVTGNGGGAAGDDDVDGGTTTLNSPVMDLSAYTNPVVRFYRWFYNAGGTGTPNDSLVISLVNGTQVIDIDKVGQGASSNQWIYKSYRVKDYIANPGANITFRCRTFDVTAGHLVEAALDLFRVVDSTSGSSVPPVANFSSSSTQVCAGQQITFNDLSTNNPTNWSWSFQGGTPSTSTSQNPIVSYATPGTYSVTLTASNLGGNNTVAQTSYITVNSVVAAFSKDKTSVCPGETVTFTNESSCLPTTYQWTFQGGSPATSTDANPQIMYTTPGYYDVTLVAGNQYGNNTLVQNLSVQVYAPAVLTEIATADTNTTGVGTATVNVNGGVTPYTYVWSDANHQTTATATALTPGVYTVTVTDGHGCQSITSMTVGNVLTNSLPSINAGTIGLFPNPGNGQFTLVSPLNGSVTIYDALGKLLIEKTAVAANTAQTFDLLQQPKGVYTLKLALDKETISLKLIKQ